MSRTLPRLGGLLPIFVCKIVSIIISSFILFSVSCQRRPSFWPAPAGENVLLILIRIIFYTKRCRDGNSNRDYINCTYFSNIYEVLSQESAGNRQIFYFSGFFLNNYEHMPIIYNMRNGLRTEDIPMTTDKAVSSGDEEISRL